MNRCAIASFTSSQTRQAHCGKSRAAIIAIIVLAIIPRCAIAAPQDIGPPAGMLEPVGPEEISDMLIQALQQRGCQARIEEDYLLMTFPDGQSHNLIFRDLRLFLAYVAEEDWEEVIEVYVEIVFNSIEEIRSLVNSFQSLDDAICHLGVCLYPADYLVRFPDEEPVYRRDIDGLITCLVWDFSDMSVTAEWKDIEKWDFDIDELFSTAMENTLAKYPVTTVEASVLPGLNLIIVESAGHPISAHMLAIDRLPGAMGPYGALVSAPAHNVVFIYPIADEGVMLALMAMAEIANDAVHVAFNPLSDQVFWHNGQTFVNIPYIMGKEFPEIDIYNMPPEFLMLLLTLSN
jgi:hypothetical protein